MERYGPGVEWPAPKLVEIVGDVAEVLLGLRDLHDQGQIHGDVKEANMLRVNGHVKLADFGCAFAVPVAWNTGVQDQAKRGKWEEGSEDIKALKKELDAVPDNIRTLGYGTPHYISPEGFMNMAVAYGGAVGDISKKHLADIKPYTGQVDVFA